jgi:hypothetical protein
MAGKSDIARCASVVNNRKEEFCLRVMADRQRDVGQVTLNGDGDSRLFLSPVSLKDNDKGMDITSTFLG